MSALQAPAAADDSRHFWALGAVVAALAWHHTGSRVHGVWLRHHQEINIFSSFAGFFVAVNLLAAIWNRYVDGTLYDRWVTGDEPGAVLLGRGDGDTPIYLKENFRTLHTQVIGTTSAGKTESVILPWAIHDIERGHGLLIVDGKGERSFLDKLYAYVAKAGRERDFRLFSLSSVEASSTFNPLADGTAKEATERVFASFRFENEYYRQVQYKIFAAIIELVKSAGRVPTFALVQELMADRSLLQTWLATSKSAGATRDLGPLLQLSDRDFAEKTGGLDAQLSHFTAPEVSALFNDESPMISLGEALSRGQIVYFQLPTMYYPVLAEATGRLVLQCFQSAVARRHLGLGSGSEKPKFFACLLDDFQDYIYEGFSALLNKSRSANVGMVFSHQALGDLDKVSPAFANVVSINTNVKIVMRTGDPDTAEHFAKTFGTKAAEKGTERRTRGILGDHDTGERSVREVEEFIHHPNAIKGLGLGEGFVSFPHPRGIKTVKVKFTPRPSLRPTALPVVQKRILKAEDFLPPKVPSIGSKPRLGRPA